MLPRSMVLLLIAWSWAIFGTGTVYGLFAESREVQSARVIIGLALILGGGLAVLLIGGLYWDEIAPLLGVGGA